MDTPANRMVAVCDILGFSDLVEAEPLSLIINSHLPRFLKALENSVTQAEPTIEDLSITGLPQHAKIGIAWFSDTILIYALDDTNEACKKVVDTAGWLVFRTVFTPKTRVRVGVSYGEFFVNAQRDFFVGKALVDANKIEKQQEWMGGALSKTAEERMRRILPSLSSFPFGWWLIEYQVPVKGGTGSELIGKLAIDWTQGDHPFQPMAWSPNSDGPNPEEWQEHHAICTKWQNTRSFHERRVSGATRNSCARTSNLKMNPPFFQCNRVKFYGLMRSSRHWPSGSRV